jgi:hypothetical protein
MVTFSRTQQATRAGTPRRAGAKPTIVVEGLDAIVQQFTREAAETLPRAADVVVTFSGKVANRMRATVPVDQGDVLDSISADGKATIEPGGIYAEAGPDRDENLGAFVAPFLVNGTVKMPPRWDIQSAADETLSEFERAIRNLSRL